MISQKIRRYPEQGEGVDAQVVVCHPGRTDLTPADLSVGEHWGDSQRGPEPTGRRFHLPTLSSESVIQKLLQDNGVVMFFVFCTVDQCHDAILEFFLQERNLF